MRRLKASCPFESRAKPLLPGYGKPLQCAHCPNQVASRSAGVSGTACSRTTGVAAQPVSTMSTSQESMTRQWAGLIRLESIEAYALVDVIIVRQAAAQGSADLVAPIDPRHGQRQGKRHHYRQRHSLPGSRATIRHQRFQRNDKDETQRLAGDSQNAQGIEVVLCHAGSRQVTVLTVTVGLLRLTR